MFVILSEAKNPLGRDSGSRSGFFASLRMTNQGPTPALKVTVAIPTYNRADFLRQTLAGLVAQQFPREHFEILVIDNNSRDHTAAVVAEFASAPTAPRYVREAKQGLDHARNRALVEAR